ncbi:MAG TPA: response regulator [Gemmataceae bacterium]|nr:response regulator [Gemmataceae bacterium]
MAPTDLSRQTGRLGPAGLRLLVVDDNRDAADSLAMLLGLWGHEPRVAYDGQAALRAARAEPPDAVLLDLGMPGLDGYDLAGALRPAALIAVTGYADPAHRERAAAAGFDHFFVKPVDLDALRVMLGDLWEVRQLSIQARQLADVTAELTRQARGLIEEGKQHVKDLRRIVRGPDAQPSTGNVDPGWVI